MSWRYSIYFRLHSESMWSSTEIRNLCFLNSDFHTSKSILEVVVWGGGFPQVLVFDFWSIKGAPGLSTVWKIILIQNIKQFLKDGHITLNLNKGREQQGNMQGVSIVVLIGMKMQVAGVCQSKEIRAVQRQAEIRIFFGWSLSFCLLQKWASAMTDVPSQEIRRSLSWKACHLLMSAWSSCFD